MFVLFFALFATFMFASLAALISEKSGTINISIEGGMIMGGCSFLIFMKTFDGLLPGDIVSVFLALICTMIILMIWNLVLGFATITMLGDHIIAGTALNLFAPVIMGTVAIMAYGQTSSFPKLMNFIPAVKSDTASWGSLNQLEYLGIILIFLIISFSIISYLIYRSKWGLRLKAAGENPYAVETAGISVTKTRYITLLIVGVLTALSSMAVVLVFSKSYVTTVAGYGYIAFAILIFGSWKISGITIGSFIIAIIMALAIKWTSISNIVNLKYFMYMLPFILPLIILMIFRSKAGPSAAGKPFKKDLRE